MNTTSANFSFAGSIPENYDTYLGPILFEFSGADLAQRVHAVLDRPARVLEVACGTGISTRHLAETLPAGTQIVATDINEAMLAHAAAVNGDLPGVTYSQADALDLPFEDAEFDAVVCPFGIMFFPDKAKGMAEMSRVLKPGGLIALNVWDTFEHNAAVGVVAGVIKQFFESDPPRFLEIPFGTVGEEVGRELFKGADLHNVDVSYVSGDIPIEDFGLPARAFVTGNPSITEIEQRATVGAEEVIAAAKQALEDDFGPAPATLSFQAIVYSAIK